MNGILLVTLVSLTRGARHDQEPNFNRRRAQPPKGSDGLLDVTLQLVLMPCTLTSNFGEGCTL